jgi:hypothetical protein
LKDKLSELEGENLELNSAKADFKNECERISRAKDLLED